jgi:acyl-CoA thioester hydrolase
VSRRSAAVEGEGFVEVETRVRVRFQEVDALGVTWHGHYLSYFEEGRTALGREYSITHGDILDAGYVAPLVHAELDLLKKSVFDDVLTVRTRMHFVPGAWLHFTYRITGAEGDVRASGHTLQAFTDRAGELALCRPPFYEEFVQRWKDVAARA